MKLYKQKKVDTNSWVGKVISDDYKALCKRQERTEYRKWIEHLSISSSDKKRILEKIVEVN